jgi:hypothetical protein
MTMYTFLHSLLNVLVEIANKMGLQKKLYKIYIKVKINAIPVTDRVGLWDFEISRTPYCLNNRLNDSGSVINLKRQQHVVFYTVC